MGESEKLITVMGRGDIHAPKDQAYFVDPDRVVFWKAVPNGGGATVFLVYVGDESEFIRDTLLGRATGSFIASEDEWIRALEMVKARRTRGVNRLCTPVDNSRVSC